MTDPHQQYLACRQAAREQEAAVRQQQQRHAEIQAMLRNQAAAQAQFFSALLRRVFLVGR